jgi:hypothetical protein
LLPFLVDLRPVSRLRLIFRSDVMLRYILRRQEATHRGTIPPLPRDHRRSWPLTDAAQKRYNQSLWKKRSIYESRRVMEHNLPDTISLLSRTPATLDALLRDLPETWTYTDSTDQNQRTSDPWKSVKSASSAFHSLFPKISGSERKVFLTSGRM